MINPLLYPIIGLILVAWGGGMLSVHYLIGNDNPINTINAFGLIITGLGFAIMIKSLAVIKDFVEIIRD